MAGRLKDKVAIITGGASGMVAATVERFVAEGAHVFSTDIQANSGEAKAREAGGDLSTPRRRRRGVVAEVAATVLQRRGRLDVVMNNAGVVTKKFIEDVDLETWNRVIAINLTA